MLSETHASRQWRRMLGRPPTSLRRAVVWTRHDKVGIGNGLSGYGSVMRDALVEVQARCVWPCFFLISLIIVLVLANYELKMSLLLQRII